MRHKDKAMTPRPEKPERVPGCAAEKKSQATEENSPARLRVKVGPPEASWSHAKWLALADQALLE